MPSASPFADFHHGPVSRPQPLFHFSLVLFSLWLCTTLDHFGYPAPLFSVWRQAHWYNLHLTEVWLCEIRQNIIDGREPLPMIGAMLVDLPPREENVSGSSPTTAPTNAVTSSSNPTLVAQPTVAQKEPRNHVLHEQAVGSTIGIGASCKPTRLDSPSSAAPLHGKRGRSPSRKDKDKKSKRYTPCAKALPSVDPLTIPKHGSSTSVESDVDGN